MGQLIDAIDTGSNQEMRDIIRIPFNLRLLGELISEGLPFDEITPIKTQLELLEYVTGRLGSYGMIAGGTRGRCSKAGGDEDGGKPFFTGCTRGFRFKYCFEFGIVRY